MNKKIYLSLVGVVVVAGAAAYLASAESFLGLIGKGTGKGEQSKPFVMPFDTSKDKWWCISKEDYNKKYPQEWTPETPPPVTPGGTGKGLNPWDNGIKTPGVPGSSKTDYKAPVNKTANVKPGTSKTAVTLPDWKSTIPGVDIKNPGGSSGSNGRNTVVGSGVNSGTPGVPDVNVPGGTTQEPEEKTESYWYYCGCNVGQSITFEGVDGTYQCPKKYGDYSYAETHKPDGTTVQLSLWTSEKGYCEEQYFCPEGTTVDYPDLGNLCYNLDKLAYDKKCNKGGTDVSQIARVCEAFFGQGWTDWFKNSTPKICVSDKDCEKYLQMAKDGVFTKAAKGKNFNDTAKACMEQNTGKSWNSWDAWF